MDVWAALLIHMIFHDSKPSEKLPQDQFNKVSTRSTPSKKMYGSLLA
jgi:hypothetical protein